MNEKLSERVRARPYGKCYLDKNDMKVIAEVEALVSRLAEALPDAEKWQKYVHAIGMVPGEDEPDPILHAEYVEDLESRLRAASELVEEWRSKVSLICNSVTATNINECADELEASLRGEAEG